MDKITVKGKNVIDTDTRHRALSKLNTMPTQLLQRLAQLASNENAVAFLQDQGNFEMIKTAIGM